MEQQLQAIATVLSLVNPAICGVMFAQAEAGSSRRKQLRDATKAAMAILAILVGAALAGTRVLDLFGVSLDAFDGTPYAVDGCPVRANRIPVLYSLNTRRYW